MKLSGNRLKLRSGKIVRFKSAKKRETFERIARAYRHGWRPSRKSRR